METEEILRKLDMIFRDILKNENITLTPETTAKDVDGWDFSDEYAPHHGHRKTLQHSFRPA